jgi:hypothetical protein
MPRARDRPLMDDDSIHSSQIWTTMIRWLSTLCAMPNKLYLRFWKRRRFETHPSDVAGQHQFDTHTWIRELKDTRKSRAKINV